MKWTEEDTLKFVNMYSDAECLWNRTLPSYKDKQMRQTAIGNIVKAMGKQGFGALEAKQKIKNIRSTYLQEVRKIKNSTKSGVCTGEIYTPSVKWFAIMDLIMKTGRGPPSEVSNNLESSIADEEMQFQSHEDDPTETSTGEVWMQEPEQESPQLVSAAVAEPLYAVEDSRSVDESTTQPTVDTDEIDVFGTYVAKVLKTLPPYEAICAQQDIQGVLTKYRLGLSCNRPGVSTNFKHSPD